MLVSRRSVLTGAGASWWLSGFPERAQTDTGTGGSPSKRGLPGSLEDTLKKRLDSASTRLEPSRLSPERPSSDKASRRRCSGRGGGAQGLVGPPDAGHGGYRADAERRLTAASHSMQDPGTAIRHAAAQRAGDPRRRGGAKLGVAATSLQVRDGEVIRPRSQARGIRRLGSRSTVVRRRKADLAATSPADFAAMNRSYRASMSPPR